MKKVIAAALLITISIPSFAQSALYPLPASWSLRAVASFSQPRIRYLTEEQLESSGSPTNGDVVILASSPNPVLMRHNGSGWITVGGSVGESGASLYISATGTRPVGEEQLWYTMSSGTLAIAGTATGATSVNPAVFSDQISGAWFIGNYPYEIMSRWKAMDAYPGEYWESSRMVADGFQDWSLDEETGTTPIVGVTHYSIDFIPGHEASSWKLYAGNYGSPTLPQIATSPSPISSFAGRVFYALDSVASGTQWKFRFFGSSEIRVRDISFWSAVDSVPYYVVRPPATFTVDSISIRPSTATPSSPATGTLWMDGNATPPKMKAWDGTSWNALW